MTKAQLKAKIQTHAMAHSSLEEEIEDLRRAGRKIPESKRAALQKLDDKLSELYFALDHWPSKKPVKNP